jgi:uncharacterized protein (TIRG00374 family)
MKRPARNTWKYALSIVVGLGLLGGVLYYVGWRRIFAEMRALGVAGISGIVGSVLLAMAAWTLSWWIILRSYGIRLPLPQVIGARLSGYAISYLTPTLYFGGEPVRALMVTGKTDAPTTRVFATVFIERFLGGLSMILFILVGSFFAISSPALPWPEKRLLISGVGFITFWILLGLVDFAWNLKWISRPIRFLGVVFRRWRGPLGRAADKVSETEDEIHFAFTKHWRGTVLAFLVQLLATFFVYMRPQVFFYFSSGQVFTFPQLSLLFTLTVILLSFFLWITPGGIGTGEAAIIGILHLVAPSISKQRAVAFSLMFKFAESILVAIGLYYLAQRGIARIGRARPSEEAPPPLDP